MSLDSKVRNVLALKAGAAIAASPVQAQDKPVLPDLKGTVISEMGQQKREIDLPNGMWLNIGELDMLDIDPDYVQTETAEVPIHVLIREVNRDGEGSPVLGDWILEKPELAENFEERYLNHCVGADGDRIPVTRMVRHVDNPMVPAALGLEPGEYALLVNTEGENIGGNNPAGYNSCAFTDSDTIFINVTPAGLATGDEEQLEKYIDVIINNYDIEVYLIQNILGDETPKDECVEACVDPGPQPKGPGKSDLEVEVGDFFRVFGGAMLEHFQIQPLGVDPTGTVKGFEAGLVYNDDANFLDALIRSGRMEFDDINTYNRFQDAGSDGTIFTASADYMHNLVGPLAVGASADYFKMVEDIFGSATPRLLPTQSNTKARGNLGLKFGDGKDYLMLAGSAGGEWIENVNNSRHNLLGGGSARMHVAGDRVGLEVHGDYFKRFMGSSIEVSGDVIEPNDGHVLDVGARLNFRLHEDLGLYLGFNHHRSEESFQLTDPDGVVEDLGTGFGKYNTFSAGVTYDLNLPE